MTVPHADLALDGQSLDLAAVAAVARAGARVSLSDAARERMAASQAWVQATARGEMPIYGVNTGYGSLARVRIAPDDIQALSMNLVRSHAAGVGPALPREAVRGMMLLRANALAKGSSGCRPALVDTLCRMLAEDVVPEVPSQGSCGSSGDLAPLAHLGLVLFHGPDADSGVAWYRGERLTGAEAMRRAGIQRLEPAPKEGLAVTNGAQLSTALAALACHDARRLLLAAEISAAMSIEALRGVTRAFHPDVQKLRPYAGAQETARNLLRLVAGSTLVDSVPDKVQDAYSLRCTPQVVGAVRDGVRFACKQVSVEINSATDNPVILLDAEGVNKAFSAGLFHGEPVGMAADHLKLALCELAALAERRLYRLTTGTLSSRLPPLLAERDRPSLGLMVPQTTAAALVAHARQRCFPSTADSIPTCEDQEDHVAMSTTAARRAVEVVADVTRVVAIELRCAAEGLRVRKREDGAVRLGRGTSAALDVVEGSLGRSSAGASAVLGDDIEALAGAIASGELVDAVRRAAPELEEVTW